jgi:hypothetical protein
MDWSFRRLNLKWYEYLWALLPLTLTAIGGAIGGLCGGAAALANLKIMQASGTGRHKYLATALISLISVGVYIGLLKVVVFSIGSGTVTSVRVDQALQNSAIFKAVLKVDPAAYAKIRDALIEADPKAPSEFDAIAQPHVAALIKRYLPSASDAAILDFTRVLALEIDQIGSQNADACIAFIAPSPSISPISVRDFLSSEIMQHDAEAGAAVIESASQVKSTVPPKSEISGVLSEVVQRMTAKYGSDGIATFTKLDQRDHKKFCTMTGDFYKTVLSLPVNEAIPFLRYIYSRNSAI